MRKEKPAGPSLTGPSILESRQLSEHELHMDDGPVGLSTDELRFIYWYFEDTHFPHLLPSCPGFR